MLLEDICAEYDDPVIPSAVPAPTNVRRGICTSLLLRVQLVALCLIAWSSSGAQVSLKTILTRKYIDVTFNRQNTNNLNNYMANNQDQIYLDKNPTLATMTGAIIANPNHYRPTGIREI